MSRDFSPFVFICFGRFVLPASRFGLPTGCTTGILFRCEWEHLQKSISLNYLTPTKFQLYKSPYCWGGLLNDLLPYREFRNLPKWSSFCPPGLARFCFQRCSSMFFSLADVFLRHVKNASYLGRISSRYFPTLDFTYYVPWFTQILATPFFIARWSVLIAPRRVEDFRNNRRQTHITTNMLSYRQGLPKLHRRRLRICLLLP